MSQTYSDTISVVDTSILLACAKHMLSNTSESDRWEQADPNASIENKREKDSSLLLQFKTVTKSEEYIRDTFSTETSEQIKAAIMELYLSNLDHPHVLTGLLTMISCIPYRNAVPQCPIMALGLLQNKDISIRDKAIQVFEKWNSKEGIPILRSLQCDRKWLQKYVDKVILYLERDGLD